jgi:hypothetical protein
MPTPPKELANWIARIPEHVGEMPAESASPIEHYTRGANDAWNLLKYFDRTAKRTTVYRAPYERHLVRLRSLVLLALVETFERFLKELAAACVDHLASIVLDDRLSILSVRPSAVAAHFDEETIGKALCEGSTWLDSSEINTRFGRLLADHFGDPKFKFFPGGRADPDAWRRGAMDVLWQLRHSIAHNVGVITKSDAAKLRLLRRGPVAAPKMLQLTHSDVFCAKGFLDDLAQWSNGRVAARLAEVLTARHADDASLFAPQDRADGVAKVFQIDVIVAGAPGTP